MANLIYRCLEEGAEEFIVKPVKLSDVKRLKDFIMRGEGEEKGKTKIQKRKMEDDDIFSFSSQLPSSDSEVSSEQQSSTQTSTLYMSKILKFLKTD